MEQGLQKKIERREFIRMEIPLTVRISILDSEKIIGRNVGKEGKICNISMTGACLELPPPQKSLAAKGYDSIFEFKNKMKMEIELFNEFETIEILAESHWYHIKTKEGTRRLYVGVSFLGMGQGDKNTLGVFLSSIENGSFFMKNTDEAAISV